MSARHASAVRAAMLRGALAIGEAEAAIARSLSRPGWDAAPGADGGFREAARSGCDVASRALDAGDYALAAWALRGLRRDLEDNWPDAAEALAARRPGGARVEVDPGDRGGTEGDMRWS